MDFAYIIVGKSGTSDSGYKKYLSLELLDEVNNFDLQPCKIRELVFYRIIIFRKEKDMLKKIFVISCLMFVYQNSLSQIPDATVVVHQNTLNGFLTAVGPISGKDQYNVLGAKGEYIWTLSNARIELMPDKARFVAEANVKTGPFSYSSVATGDVEVKYNQEMNRISVKVLKAEFEVYTKIFGKKIHITNIDAAKYYKPEFEFAGPQPVQPSVLVNLPNGTSKTIYIKPVSQNMRIAQEQIIVTSHLKFSSQPISR